MREYLNATRLVTKLKMLRSLYKKTAFLIVEGVSDARLYGKFMNKQSCHIIVGENKQNILGALTRLEEEKFIGFLAIVDLDYDYQQKEEKRNPNLFYTDSHDLETLLLNSSALDNVLVEYGDEKKINHLEQKSEKRLVDIIAGSAATVGYLRWCSLEKKLAFRFENLDFSAFICERTLEVDEDLMLKYVLKNSKRPVPVEEELLDTWLREYKERKYNPWMVCSGHDAVRILLLGLLNFFGAYNAKKLTANTLEGSLRLAYTFDDFRETELYFLISQWEAKNEPFAILKQRKVMANAG
ncbi:DUF4435 domain-containing protein [Heliorestis acidaminivorans]|uniref:DUF4435 domain-containing protein n=1 Tax=Heliorestis acidaminivorans TaxID=553427 RepID=A0A6I0F5N4_9FIRM|nr:DUF4435 domain-containing protein [Heliorestis acidaminivorans]KAB2954147.1 DUF4435 domain-containing protein [Heliorestis acidaminivorans]